MVLAAPEGVSSVDAFSALCDFESSHKRPPVSEEEFESLVSELSTEGFFRQEGPLLFP